MSTAEKRQYSIQEYLDIERASETKHEYYQGEIFAMGGASLAHTDIVSNLVKRLGNFFEEGSCRALPNDIRVKVDATGLYTYPDVTVVCSQPQLEDGVFDTLLNPKLIVEVLSESTEAYDRGQKFAHYRTIDSLEEYVLVSQDDDLVEVFTRQENGQWLLSEARRRDSSIYLRSLDCRLSLQNIYQRVEIPAPRQDPTHD
jgi:Uma2 family endonuclease